MTPCTSTVLPRPALPTLVDVWTEPLGSDLDHQPEDPASPAAPALTPALIEDSVWPSLAAPALYGPPGALSAPSRRTPKPIQPRFSCSSSPLSATSLGSQLLALMAHFYLVKRNSPWPKAGDLVRIVRLCTHFRVAEAQTCSPGNWS
jgi:hypothetical protein